MYSVDFPTTHSRRIPELAQSLAGTDRWPAGSIARSNPAAPLSRLAQSIFRPDNQQREKPMHPLRKTARIAGAIYLSMVLTAPFISGCMSPGENASCAEMPPPPPTTSWFTRRRCFVLRSSADSFLHYVIFICLGIALYRLLSSVGSTWALF